MTPDPAQYLLRFDDLCPTMDRRRWLRFLPLIEHFDLRPILAVVPDNRDPELYRSIPDPHFWRHMRDLQSSGATIGLHGFHHLCSSRGHSLVPIHQTSEFAGIPLHTQRLWVREGLHILRANGLQPDIWVAPRHGFDRNTLAALRAEGIARISDGLARTAFLRDNLLWIPQQLWQPQPKSKGLWTVCVHPGTAPDSLVEVLRRFLEEHAPQCTSVDRIAADTTASLDWRESIHEQKAILHLRIAKIKKRIFAQAN